MISSVKRHLKIPVNVIIRPRGGDFNYSDEEVLKYDYNKQFEVMCNDINACKLVGVEYINI